MTNLPPYALLCALVRWLAAPAAFPVAVAAYQPARMVRRRQWIG